MRLRLFLVLLTTLSFFLPMLSPRNPGLGSASAQAADDLPFPAMADDDDDDDDDDEEEVSEEEQLTYAIRTRLAELTSARDARYDGKVVRITYKNETNFNSDAQFPVKLKGDIVSFDRMFMAGLKKEDPACFGAHSQGLLVLKPRFKGDVEINADVQFQMALPGASFHTFVHYEEQGYWGSDLGVHIVHRKPKKRAKLYRNKSKSYNRPPGKWVNRVSTSKVGFQFDMTNKRAFAKLSGGPMREISLDKEMKPKKKDQPMVTPAGQVGFAWNNMKFVVKSVTIVGELDRDWAAEMLSFQPESGD